MRWTCGGGGSGGEHGAIDEDGGRAGRSGTAFCADYKEAGDSDGLWAERALSTMRSTPEGSCLIDEGRMSLFYRRNQRLMKNKHHAYAIEDGDDLG